MRGDSSWLIWLSILGWLGILGIHGAPCLRSVDFVATDRIGTLVTAAFGRLRFCVDT